MGQSHNLQGEQLAMFMSPNDIKAGGYKFGDGGENIEPGEEEETTTAIREHKLRGADKSWGGNKSLAQSVESEGVKEPIGLHTSAEKRVLRQGHHRYFSQERADPNKLMPVVHSDNAGGALTEYNHTNIESYQEGAAHRDKQWKRYHK